MKNHKNVPENSAPSQTKITQSPSDQDPSVVPPQGEHAGGNPVATPEIDFDWCIKFFEKHGKEQFGPQFRIWKDDEPLIYKLLIYFLQHEKEAQRLGLDINKGILLSGPIGCGKSALMKLMKYVPCPERNFILKPCRDVSFEFIGEGYTIITTYSKLSYNANYPKIYCFDDLGTETSLKYYGNECNVMAEILLSRYDLFKSFGMLTHITTNLSASELENQYGNRLRSRLREMCNLISFHASSPDKRH